MNLDEIIKLKYPDVIFGQDVLLEDASDGNGPYIAEWNLSDPIPDETMINDWTIEFDLEYRKNKVREQRRLSYPSIQDQLDMQYWDAVENTTKWQQAIESVKLQYPLPTQ